VPQVARVGLAGEQSPPVCLCPSDLNPTAKIRNSSKSVLPESRHVAGPVSPSQTRSSLISNLKFEPQNLSWFCKRDFYFRAPGSLVVLSFPQPLNFSSVFPSL
jgi:hypothetical protein